ncbi:RNA ligase family protein [Pseudomonas sp. UBA1879]|uniref:RNA ligase family protein n=1 Tax=Pseudomonas sp. UBA1879 TaxID=1947305 RepID=UPI0025D41A9A|nr:RNA ligase family protein [Pseudomonas sp. UBA1879]
MNDFFRFPHTPHLTWLANGRPRDDKVLSPAEVEEILSAPIVIEEKLDGANLGLSIGPDGAIRVQNRGNYLSPPFTGQFEKLKPWLKLHEDSIFDSLDESVIVFGEWCAARHSLDYVDLPDFFLGFDVYDRNNNSFWSTDRRNTLLSESGLASVSLIARGLYKIDELKKIASGKSSVYRNGNMEGIVVRKENSDFLIQRAKIVRSEFTQAIQEHWSKRGIEWNKLDNDH